MRQEAFRPQRGLLTDGLGIPWTINVRNPNSAVAVRARAFSLCVAVALIVSCGSSRNKADDVKAATDAIRQQIAKYTAALDAADLNLASQVWRTSAEISFIHPPVTHTAGRK
jgi:hypothetical protein